MNELDLLFQTIHDTEQLLKKYNPIKLRLYLKYLKKLQIRLERKYAKEFYKMLDELEKDFPIRKE